MSDLFGVGGQQLLQRVGLPPTFAARIGSATRVLEYLDFEIEVFTNLITGWLRGHRGYTAIQAIPGVGAILGAVFVAEIGDVHRFPGPGQLASWAGLTPKHHESDTTVHRGRITKQGSTLVRWAAVEAVQRISTHHRLGSSATRLASAAGTTSVSSQPPAS
ncbi:MAG TPA: transposase [Pseudonocardiaceae bacterium]|nr:transposase [Pseudonocardiaceae bacterium]